jgi:hypothetical protein
MNNLDIPRDFATSERKRFVRNISPFHRDESAILYALAWLSSLIFGTRMPHERTK